MSTAPTRLLSPEEIAVRAGEQVPFLRFAERATHFGEREMRLRQLAAGHAMRDYLLFVADVAAAQGAVFGRPIDVDLPTPSQIDAASRAGRPLLAASEWRRDPRWLALLRDVLERLDARLADGPARVAVRALRGADDGHIEGQADRLLAGVMLGLDVGSAPLVAAGLQVYFSHLVLATQAAHGRDRVAPFGRVDDETLCPCCGSRPIASVLRIGAAEAGFRYLACSLCSTQWHMVRIKCSHCLSTAGIAYQSLRSLAHEGDARGGAEGDDGRSVEGAGASARAVEAECCGECGHYLKILHMERDPNVDPTADDLATLTLDLLVSDAGSARHGVDLMLLFGDPEPAGDPGGG